MLDTNRLMDWSQDALSALVCSKQVWDEVYSSHIVKRQKHSYGSMRLIFEMVFEMATDTHGVAKMLPKSEFGVIRYMEPRTQMVSSGTVVRNCHGFRSLRDLSPYMAVHP